MISLDKLTNEIFELIVPELDLKSICNLRLVCRETCWKANQDTFRSFFRKKSVKLTTEELKVFAQVTEGDLGCSLEDLTLIGLVYHPGRLGLRIEDLRRSDDFFKTAVISQRKICKIRSL